MMNFEENAWTRLALGKRNFVIKKSFFLTGGQKVTKIVLQ